MRRRWIAALVLTASLVFLVVGTALGYWAIPDSKGQNASCIVARAEFEDGRWEQRGVDFISLRDWYDDNCR